MRKLFSAILLAVIAGPWAYGQTSDADTTKIKTDIKSKINVDKKDYNYINNIKNIGEVWIRDFKDHFKDQYVLTKAQVEDAIVQFYAGHFKAYMENYKYSNEQMKDIKKERLAQILLKLIPKEYTIE